MNRPFDLEAARRGDPIEVCICAGRWERREFIGTFCGLIGTMVVYVENNQPEFTVLAGARMARKERIVFVNIGWGNVGNWYGTAQEARQNSAGHKLLAIAVPVTFEE